MDLVLPWNGMLLDETDQPDAETLCSVIGVSKPGRSLKRQSIIRMSSFAGYHM